jgi:glutamate/tyrosine decarboxylase-like PLP-dependent enzyme
MAGARPASPIACSWAVLNYLGVQGYTEIVRGLAELTARFRAVVEGFADVELVGDPVGPVLAMRPTRDGFDLHAVADAMADRGWYLNRNLEPRGLQLMLSPGHAAVLDELIADLTASMAAVRDGFTAARRGDAATRYS